MSRRGRYGKAAQLPRPTNRLGLWRAQLLCLACAAMALAVGYFLIINFSPLGAIVLLPVVPLAVIGVATRAAQAARPGQELGLALAVRPCSAGLRERGQALSLDVSGSTALASLPLMLAAITFWAWVWIEIGSSTDSQARTALANRRRRAVGSPDASGRYCAAIASAWRRSTLTSCETPRSGMVTP
jgi:hypothetical protein